MPMLRGLPRRADRVTEALRRHPDASIKELARIARTSPIFVRVIKRLDTAPPYPRRRLRQLRETPLQRRMRRRFEAREYQRRKHCERK